MARTPTLEATTVWTPGTALRATLHWLAHGRERRRQRQALYELNDELLRDIGLTRAEAWAEASKPWWR